jgi:hypothetical protein
MVGAGLAAMAVLQRRTSACYASLFSLFICVLAVTPRALGDAFDATCYSMIYNRYGEAFLALLGALLFLTPENALKKSWPDWVEAGFAGFCLTLLFFCKMNYFAVGVGFFALACLRRRFVVHQGLLVLLSAAACFALALILTKIPLSALWGDYRVMMAAQSLGDRLPGLAFQVAKSILFLPILWLLTLEISRKQDEPRAAWPHFLLVAVIFGSELCLVASNTQRGELPLLALAALVGAETIRRQTRVMAEDRFFIAVRNSAAALLFLFFLLPTLATDLKTIRYSVKCTVKGLYVTPETLRSTRLSDFRFVSAGSRAAEMRDYEAMVDEGNQLLSRHVSPQMRLAVFVYTNPFHIALGLRPAKGGAACFSATAITRRSHPPLKRLLGDATHILVDRFFGGTLIGEAYGEEWDALNLEISEQTKDYTLFKVPEGNENTKGLRNEALRIANPSDRAVDGLKHR